MEIIIAKSVVTTLDILFVLLTISAIFRSDPEDRTKNVAWIMVLIIVFNIGTIWM